MGVREFIHESRYILGGWLFCAVLGGVVCALLKPGIAITAFFGAVFGMLGIIGGMALELRVERKAGRQWP